MALTCDTFPVQLLLKTSSKFIVVRVSALGFAKFEDSSVESQGVPSKRKQGENVRNVNPMQCFKTDAVLLGKIQAWAMARKPGFTPSSLRPSRKYSLILCGEQL